MADKSDAGPLRARRVLATLGGRDVGTTRGVFELASGQWVEAHGDSSFDTATSPKTGDKVFLVMDSGGQPLRGEIYPGASLRTGGR